MTSLARTEESATMTTALPTAPAAPRGDAAPDAIVLRGVEATYRDPTGVPAPSCPGWT